MKQLWNILMDKLTRVDPIAALIAIGIMGIFTIGMMTKIIVEFFFMITQIVAMFSGQPAG
jgi:hypothetical protein